ncbi:hypothetical protein [Salinisphaera sp.]|uniref:hypothetical protein n=1 Tax=Salinisphaera sp. TaxID=1914330 RepID=UPI002D78DB7B|nr:hypothetical protein [Salinisphaera sp.]HET7314032.1 hypothetical protein [Salinisphaera sp.]
MAHDEHNPLTHPEVRNASTGLYVAAFVLGMAAMGIACLVTVGFDLSQVTILTWLAVLAAVASLGQLYLLFKLDLSRAMLWHTVSLVLTIPLFFMAIGLTIFMFHYLEARVMLGS